MRECLNLQGFLADYAISDILLGEQCNQLENTVCVPVVDRIAEAISVAATR